MDMRFRDSGNKECSVEEVVKEIHDFMGAKKEASYNIMVGTDSQLLSDKTADFVTAIVVHRVGHGGRYFWRKIPKGKFYTLRDRILEEVLLSIDIAKEVLVFLGKHKEIDFGFEIHVDVGEKGETRAIIQEVVGMVTAHNFEARTKPLSYAASKVADLYC